MNGKNISGKDGVVGTKLYSKVAIYGL